MPRGMAAALSAAAANMSAPPPPPLKKARVEPPAVLVVAPNALGGKPAVLATPQVLKTPKAWAAAAAMQQLQQRAAAQPTTRRLDMSSVGDEMFATPAAPRDLPPTPTSSVIGGLSPILPCDTPVAQQRHDPDDRAAAALCGTPAPVTVDEALGTPMMPEEAEADDCPAPRLTADAQTSPLSMYGRLSSPLAPLLRDASSACGRSSALGEAFSSPRRRAPREAAAAGSGSGSSSSGSACAQCGAAGRGSSAVTATAVTSLPPPPAVSLWGQRYSAAMAFVAALADRRKAETAACGMRLEAAVAGLPVD